MDCNFGSGREDIEVNVGAPEGETEAGIDPPFVPDIS